jgi:polyphosphate kinase
MKIHRARALPRDAVGGHPEGRPRTANLLQSVEADLKQRKFAGRCGSRSSPTRPPLLQRWLLDKLNLDPQDVYELRVDGVLALSEIADLDRPDLKEQAVAAGDPGEAAAAPGKRARDAGGELLRAIRKQDILVHHPYESFHDSRRAVHRRPRRRPGRGDDQADALSHEPGLALHRVLIRAAEAGKQVACLVELRARFDEDRNVRFARQLEKAGVHVAYGVVGLKTHCKTSLVVRKERRACGATRTSAPATTTPRPRSSTPMWACSRATPASRRPGEPLQLPHGAARRRSRTSAAGRAVQHARSVLDEMIDREIENARRRGRADLRQDQQRSRTARSPRSCTPAAGGREGHADRARASAACAPGVPGLSGEHPRHLGRRAVPRALAHLPLRRRKGQEDPLDGDWYIGSADWMYRNLNNRVEVSLFGERRRPAFIGRPRERTRGAASARVVGSRP